MRKPDYPIAPVGMTGPDGQFPQFARFGVDEVEERRDAVPTMDLVRGDVGRDLGRDTGAAAGDTSSTSDEVGISRNSSATRGVNVSNVPTTIGISANGITTLKLSGTTMLTVSAVPTQRAIMVKSSHCRARARPPKASWAGASPSASVRSGRPAAAVGARCSPRVGHQRGTRRPTS